jgi:hypothetical protein
VALRGKSCYSAVEIAHPGGEALLVGAACDGIEFSISSRGNRISIIGGTTKARRIELRFADGETMSARLRHGVFLAAFPFARLERAFSIVATNADGSVTSQPWPVFGVEFTSALRG